MDSSHEKAKIMDDHVASTKAKLHAAAAERKHLMYTNSRQTEQLKAFLADYHGLSQKIEVSPTHLNVFQIYCIVVRKLRPTKITRCMTELLWKRGLNAF